MPDLATIGAVEATVTHGGRTTTMRRVCLRSSRVDAACFARAVRAHRAIDDSPHQPPGVGIEKDRARARRDNRPADLATIGRPALSQVWRAGRGKGAA
jgi:predicted transposase YbfD/YdcC